MSQPDDALSGTEVYVKGPYTFHVTTQTTVVAKGKTIMLFPSEQTRAEWWGQDTGEGGKPVKDGYTVFVNDATVVFRV